jgi:hemerythrin-like domain-containing protein
MSAVERLFEEHRLIERVVTAFARRTTGIVGDSERLRSDMLRFVIFFREFADLLHHEKEEGILMPVLVLTGFKWDEGVILQVRRDHEHERNLLQSLRQLALQTRGWSTNDCRRVLDFSERFVSFIRTHMNLEEQQLHSWVMEQLSPEVFDALESKLRRFDEKRELSGEIDLLVTLGEELCNELEPDAF